MVIPANLWRMFGTSGHAVPLLDGNNTWSGTETFDGLVTFNGGTTPPIGGGADTRKTKTANYQITTADVGVQFDNIGASGAVILTLPASPPLGTKYGFQIAASQYLEVLANTGQTISMGPVTSASAGN